MQVYILNQNYERIGELSEQEDIVFNKRFNDVGYCALKVAADAEMLELLRAGNYIYRYDDDIICRIETATIDTNVEQGDYLTVDAVDMNNILAGRIIRWDVTYSGTVAGFIKRLITENVINPAQSARKIANFEFDDSNFSEFTEKINVVKETAAQDLLQLVIATCKTYNYGFRVSLNIETRKLVFRLIKGKNKATTDSDEYIEFSPNYANIISSKYKEDMSNYKNVVYVGYKSANKDDENVYLLSLFNDENEPQGEERREVYVDATNTSREIDIATLQTIFNGSVKRNPATQGAETSGYYYITQNGAEQKVATFEVSTTDGASSEKITVTDYTYLLLIRATGYNKLAEHIKTQEFSGEVDTIDTYEYKKDYDLGDIVYVENEYGIGAASQITEVTESENADSPFSIEPKFEFIY